jgi:hypothetical protein
MNICIQMQEVKISYLLNTPLNEFLGLTPPMILIIFFSNINIFLLLDEFPRKLFHTSL